MSSQGYLIYRRPATGVSHAVPHFWKARNGMHVVVSMAFGLVAASYWSQGYLHGANGFHAKVRDFHKRLAAKYPQFYATSSVSSV